MKITRRIRTIVQSKVTRVIDRWEDPREMLDQSYEEIQDLITEVKKKALQTATSKKELEHKVSILDSEIEDLEIRAKKALEDNDEESTKFLLYQKVLKEEQRDAVRATIPEIQDELKAIQGHLEELYLQKSEVLVKKEKLKALYTSSEAQVAVEEMISGLDEKGPWQKLEKAEEKVIKLKARSGAIKELANNNILNEGSDRHLTNGRIHKKVEDQLACLKEELDK